MVTDMTATAATPHVHGDDKMPSLTLTTSAKKSPDDEPVSSAAPHAGWLHWHEPGTSAEEKRLLFKLDWFLLSFSCLTYFIKQVSEHDVDVPQRYAVAGGMHHAD